jgi:hypothetical protein
LLHITNKATDNKYCDAKGNICKILKYSPQASFGLEPIIIPIILLCSLNMLTLDEEFQQSDSRDNTDLVILIIEQA